MANSLKPERVQRLSMQKFRRAWVVASVLNGGVTDAHIALSELPRGSCIGLKETMLIPMLSLPCAWKRLAICRVAFAWIGLVFPLIEIGRGPSLPIRLMDSLVESLRGRAGSMSGMAGHRGGDPAPGLGEKQGLFEEVHDRKSR